MKLIDEVAALSSVEALESLCAPITDGRRAAITQNLNALRDQLTAAAVCKHGIRHPHACDRCADADQPVAWRMRWEEEYGGGWSDWLLFEAEPRERASRTSEIEPLYTSVRPRMTDEHDKALIAKGWARFSAAAPRRFTGVGHLERTGYIPEGAAAERAELASFDAWVKSKGPLCASGRFSPTAHEAWLERAREAGRLINRMTAMVKWLEANQPDVWTRGLWDAMNAADADSSRATSQVDPASPLAA